MRPLLLGTRKQFCFRGVDRLVSDLTARSLGSGSSRAAEELPLLLDELN